MQRAAPLTLGEKLDTHEPTRAPRPEEAPELRKGLAASWVMWAAKEK